MGAVHMSLPFDVQTADAACEIQGDETASRYPAFRMDPEPELRLRRYQAEIWVVGLDGSNPHKVVGTVGNDPNNSTYIAAWDKGKFLIGGYQGLWDPYFVAETGGEPVRVPASQKDDKPSDRWVP